MIKILKTEDNKKLLKLSISEAVSGSWFSLISPNEEEIKQVSLVLGLDEDFLLNSLDLDERSRIEIEDGNTLIITNLPIMTEDGCFDTLPLGIIYTPTSIITVCSKDNNILSSFNETTAYSFDTRNKTEFMLKMLYRSVKFYLKYLDIINRTTENIEIELQKATNNKALFQLMEIQKTLVYFSTALKDNDIVKKLMEGITNIFMFDLLLKESDRTLKNIEIIENGTDIKLAPLYDTSSIFSDTNTKLGIDEEDYLKNDIDKLNKFLEYSDNSSKEKFYSYLETLDSIGIEKIIKETEKENNLIISNDLKDELIAKFNERISIFKDNGKRVSRH